MSIAKRVKDFLEAAGVRYKAVAHARSASSSETAQAAHVPGDQLAKSVVVHHEKGYVVAVVPSSHRVDLQRLQDLIERRMGLATEREIRQLFYDCDTGAVPPIGEAYGLKTLVDSSLDGQDDIWFEGGDHETLVQVSGRDFDRLMRDCQHASFSRHV